MARTKATAAVPADPDAYLAGEGRSLLLAALALALTGEQPLLGEGGLFPNSPEGNRAAGAALECGYLGKRVETVPAKTKKGKPTEKVFGSISDKGRQLYQESETAKPSAVPDTTAWAAAIDEACARLRLSFEVSLADLRRELFAALQPAPTAAPRTPRPAPATTLREALRQAYDELCLYKEFRDHVVEIPRLYHETVRRHAGLSVAQFHAELEALNRERQIELKATNDPYLATESHLGINRDDRLYYYVFWKVRP